MNRFVRTSVSIAATEIGLMVVALLRNKYLAVKIGPEGLGLYGLLSSFFNVAAVFSGTWLAIGATKYTAQFQKENDIASIRRVRGLTASLAILVSIVTIAILFVGRDFVIKYFLTPEISSLYYLLFLGALFGISLRPILTGILQGLMEVRKVVVSRISISLFEVLSIFAMTYFWGLTGFFVSILVSSLFAAFFLWGQIGRLLGTFSFPKFDRDQLLNNLLKFGGVAFLLGFVNLASQYCQRIIVVQVMDVKSVGLFQAGVTLMGYLGIFNRGSDFYLLPKMSETMHKEARCEEINRYLFVTMAANISISVIAILFGKELIRFLYSSDFLALSSVFYLFVFGGVFTVLGAALQTVVVGMAKLRLHTIFTITIHGIWILVPLILAGRFGIGALGLSFIIGGVFTLLSYGWLLTREIGFKPSKNLVLFSVVGFLFLTGMVLVKDVELLIRVLIVGITIFVGATALRNVKELKFLKDSLS